MRISQNHLPWVGPATRPLRRTLVAAVATLDPMAQQVLALRFGERRSTAEIATLLGYSRERVQRLQYHALVEVQRLVAG